jgi:hypothetical protein
MSRDGVSEAHTVDTARAAAERDELGEWVSQFLRSPGSDNAALAEKLGDQGWSWLGPVQLPLDELHRLAGPPGAPVPRAVAEEEWRDDVADLAERVDAGAEPPPVVVTYRDDQLMLEDGNHRVEALRRAGISHAWAVVGFDTPEARDRFVERSRQNR